jgi:C-terminal processing protease CtpA/Prc
MNLLIKKNWCICLVFLALQNLYAQNSKAINWEKDLEIYKTTLLQNHIDVFHTVSEKTFLQEWNAIYKNTATLNDFEIMIKLMQLTRRIQDGHTAVSIKNMATKQFPIEINMIENKWRVVSTIKEQQAILKSTLIAIDGVPIETIALKISEIAQFVENQYSLQERTGSYIPNAVLLYQLKLTKSPNNAVFTFKNTMNQVLHIPLTAMEETVWNEKKQTIKMHIGIPQIKQPKEVQAGCWFSPIQNTKAVYINFSSYPTFEEMQHIGEQLVHFIELHQIKEVIIDVRHNGGGDLYVGTVLAYALNLANSIDWKQGVYVLTSNYTFSAATSNAALFKQLLNATIVGEPTGSNPNGYQDMDTFTLPNSGLVITYSKRLFRIGTQAHTALLPTIPIAQNWNDFLNDTDTVLKTMYTLLKSRSYTN